MSVIELILKPQGEGANRDLADKRDRIIHLGNNAPPIQIAALKRGMTDGRTSLMIRMEIPDGRFVLAEISLRAFLTAANALKAAFPDG